MEGKQPGRLFRLAGVCGSGKSTTAALIEKMARESPLPYRQVHATQLLLALAGVHSEWEYRQLPEEDRRAFFPALVRHVTESVVSDPASLWYFERHLCSMDEYGTIAARGVPDEHGRMMIGLAVLTAREEQIVYWREADARWRGDRHLLSPEQVALEQGRERELALQASQRWGFPARVFVNDAGQVIRVAREIFSFLEELSR